MASLEQLTEIIRTTIAAANDGLVEALRETRKGDGKGNRDKVGDQVEKLVKRTKEFGGDGYQEWKF